MGVKNRDFPNNEELEKSFPIEFAILIPSTRDKSIRISQSAFQKRIDNAVRWLTRVFGGTTIDVESGTYQLRGKTIKELVAVITVHTSVKQYNKFDERIEKYLRDKKKSWGQDSMGYIYQGKMVFI